MMSSTRIAVWGAAAPGRMTNAPRRFWSRAARLSRCCLVVGRARSSGSETGSSSQPSELTGKELGLVVAARSTALDVHRHGHQGRRSGQRQQLAKRRLGRASKDRGHSGRAGVLQCGERATRWPVVGECRQRQRERLPDHHCGIGRQEAICGSRGALEGIQAAGHSRAPERPQAAQAGGMSRSRSATIAGSSTFVRIGRYRALTDTILCCPDETRSLPTLDGIE